MTILHFHYNLLLRKNIINHREYGFKVIEAYGIREKMLKKELKIVLGKYPSFKTLKIFYLAVMKNRLFFYKITGFGI